jgi:hypothetical protein
LRIEVGCACSNKRLPRRLAAAAAAAAAASGTYNLLLSSDEEVFCLRPHSLTQFAAAAVAAAAAAASGTYKLLLSSDEEVFCLRPHSLTQSAAAAAAAAAASGTYKLLLSSDEEVFGGWRNLSKETDGDHVSFGVSNIVIIGVMIGLIQMQCCCCCSLVGRFLPSQGAASKRTAATAQRCKMGCD